MALWLALLGGVALFSYGLTVTAEAIGTVTRGPLRHWMLWATRTSWSSAGLGIVATLLAGSSSAITVMVVTFVGAGLISLPRALAVILGAAIGTTLTVQLVSFHVVQFAPVLVFLGVVVALVRRWRRIPVTGYGMLLLGFGFLFYGMLVMTNQAGPLAANAGVRAFFHVLETVPLLPFLVALVITALIQNSATTIALAISFALHGVVRPVPGLEMVLGANVGSTAASVYNALMGTRAARRTAAAYVFMKAAGALAALAFVHPVATVLAAVDPNPARMLANGHSLFNIVNALVFLPLTGVLARWAERWWPEPPPVAAPAPRLDPGLWDNPTAALAATAYEVTQMARLIHRDMVSRLLPLVHTADEAHRRALEQAEQDVDVLQHAVQAFLSRLPRDRLTEGDRAEALRLMVLANHLEHLSDTLVKIRDTAEKLAAREFAWPEDLWDAVAPYVVHLERASQDAVQAVETADPAVARRLVQALPDLRREGDALRYRVLTRSTDWSTGIWVALLELLDDWQLLADRVAGVGRIVLGIL